MILTLSTLGKAELYANLADRRVSEIVYVANRGDAEQVKLTTQRLNYILVRIAILASIQRVGDGAMRAPAPALAPDESAESGKDVNIQANGRVKLRQILARYAVNHPARLRAALKEAPESIKPALRQAIAILVAGYEEAVRAAGD